MKISKLDMASKSPQQSFRNSFLDSMRQNLTELNRSMHSIEKMIEHSRNIIQRSRQNSLGDSLSLEKHKNTKKITITLSPRNTQHNQYTESKQEEHNENITGDIDMNHIRTHSRSKTSELTFGSQLKSSFVAAERQSLRHQQNLLKFKPKVVKQEIELRKSAVKEKMVANEEIKHNTPEKTGPKNTAYKKSPYQTINQGGNTIYKFSPQKTAKSKERSSSKTTAHKSNKIKLRPTTRQINLAESVRNKTVKDHSQNIRIEEDEDEGQLNQEENQHNTTLQKEEYYRYKTQYKEEESSDFSLSNYQLESPQPNKHNLNSRKGLKQSESIKHQKTCQSYREAKPSGIELVRPTPRQNRQILVKELQELQTVSTSEEERRAKFILKIKKYGFVEKYLNQVEIWGIYDYLVTSHVPELKWPIVIVDEVYKKIKSVK